jgi:hypothetical protein
MPPHSKNNGGFTRGYSKRDKAVLTSTGSASALSTESKRRHLVNTDSEKYVQGIGFTGTCCGC